MRITLLFLTLSAFNFLQAQNYLPLIQNQARWQVAAENDSTIAGFDLIYEYTLGKDTIINDTIYTEIWKHNFLKSAEGEGLEAYPQPFEVEELNLMGLLREDTLLRQVYYRYKQDEIYENERLLYDFSLEVGDTLNDAFEEDTSFLVIHMESVFFNGELRRIWVLSNGHLIIEGVGSELGVLEGVVALDTIPNSALYQYCKSTAMDCNVAVDGFVNKHRQFNIRVFNYSFFGSYTIKTYEYRFIDTTFLNGHTYFKLLKKQQQDQPDFEEAEDYLYWEVYLFREDDRSRVYRINTNGEEEEVLIYDFAARIENSDFYTYSSLYDNDVSVDFALESIDTFTLLNGEKRLFFYFENLDDWEYGEARWLEGIGDIRTPFFPEYSMFPVFDGPSFKLQCYYQNYEEDPIYINEDQGGSCYTYIVDTEEIRANSTIGLHPNPVNTSLQLSSPLFNGQLILYDLFGQELQRYTTDNTTIDLSNLPAACYFYQIQNKEQHYIQQGKLIKI